MTQALRTNLTQTWEALKAKLMTTLTELKKEKRLLTRDYESFVRSMVRALFGTVIFSDDRSSFPNFFFDKNEVIGDIHRCEKRLISLLSNTEEMRKILEQRENNSPKQPPAQNHKE